jgi:hypothetical protein
MEETMSDVTPEELAAEAKKPGVFNILNVLNDRGYPKDEIEVVLDDNLIYAATLINEKIKDVDKKLDADPTDKDLMAKREALIASRDEAIANINKAKYVFTLKGISEGAREEMLDAVQAEFPVEYEETTNPLNGKVSREEIDNPERNKLYTCKLWASHIEKIVSPDGQEQVGLSDDEALALRKLLPIAATAKISESIERLRVATAMFILGTDEDFLAKS